MTIDSIRVNPDVYLPVLAACIALPFLGMTLAVAFNILTLSKLLAWDSKILSIFSSKIISF